MSPCSKVKVLITFNISKMKQLMKWYCKFFFSLMIILVIVTSVDATIEVRNIKSDGSGEFGQCNGSFEFEITADDDYDLASPFKVKLLLDGEQVEVDGEDQIVTNYLGPDYQGLTTLQFGGLCAGGNYSIEVSNDYGCLPEIPIEIPGCESFNPQIEIKNIEGTDFEASLFSPNPSSNNGSITFSFAEGTASMLTIAQNSGELVTWEGQDITLDNLRGGVHFLTITDGKCTIVETFEISSCQTDKLIETGGTSVGDGTQTVDIPGFGFVVSDNSDLEFEAKIVGGLISDDETSLKVLIREHGSTEFTDVIPNDYSIRWSYSCEGEVSISTTSMFDVSFLTDGCSKVNLVISNGCIEIPLEKQLVKCGDTNSEVLSSQFVNRTEEVSPCTWSYPNGSAGSLRNGVLVLDIPKANPDDNILITINGMPPSNIIDHEGYVSASFEDLDPNSYFIEISIGDCQFKFNYRLKGGETDKEFISLDKVGGDDGIIGGLLSIEGHYQCKYRESCGEEYSRDFFETPTADFDGTAKGGLFNKCSVPISCGDDFNSDITIDDIRITAFEYRAIVDLAFADGKISPELMAHLKQQPEYYGPTAKGSSLPAWCDKIRFCPYSYLAWNNKEPILRNCGTIKDQKMDGSCIIVDCNCAPKITYCPGRIDVPGFVPSAWAINCDPVQKKAIEIFFDLSNLKEQVNFKGSELEKFLNEDIIIGNAPIEKAACVDVMYCSSSFDVVNHTLNDVEIDDCLECVDFEEKTMRDLVCLMNLNNVSEVFPLFENSELYKFMINYVVYRDERGEYVLRDPKKDCRNILYCRNTFTIEYNSYFDFRIEANLPGCPCEQVFTSTNSENNFNEEFENQNLGNKFIKDSIPNEELMGFGNTYDEDSAIPKGIIKSDSTYLKYDFDVWEKEAKKIPIKQCITFEEGFHTPKSVLLRDSRLGKELEAYSISEAGKVTKTFIDSDSMLFAGTISYEESVFVEGGFLGELNINDSITISSEYLSLFSLKIDSLGMISSSIIESLDTNLIFSNNQNGEILFASRYQGDTIIINGAAQQLSITNGIVVGGINANNEVQIKQVINAAEGVKLLDIAYAKSGDNYTLLFDGVLPLDKGEVVRGIPQLVLLTLGANKPNEYISLDPNDVYKAKNLVSYVSLSNININTSKVALTVGEENAVFLGLTFSHNLNDYNEFFKEPVNSKGLEDIALLKFNEKGTLEWHQTYGTADNENVSQLMYDNNVLFFGGEFNGETRIRELGNYRFINFTSSLQRAYISYIFDEVPSASVASKIIPEIPAQKVKTLDENIKIYPNPFSHTFNIDFTAAKAGITEVTVTDLMGKSLHVSRHDTQVGKNELAIQSLKEATGGVYYIHVKQIAEEKESVHKIIHIR